MKKVLFLCVSVFLLSHLGTAQSLSDDTDFREVVNKNNQMIQTLSSVYGVTVDKVENISAKIHELDQNSSLSEAQKYSQFDSFLGLSKANNVEYYLQAIRTSWQNVQNKFPASALSEEKVKNAIFEVLSDSNYVGARLAPQFFTLDSPDESGDCKDKAGYSICVAGATAAAILCQAGCTAGTLGFGTLICAGLCITVQLAGANECYRNYCK